MDRECLIFRMELLASKDGGERVPFVVELGRLLDDVKGICHGIALIRIELEFFDYKKGYKLYRQVEMGGDYVEVNLENLFPYTQEIGK